jgi:hypothetical protein
VRNIRPVGGDSWVKVSETARQRALAAASADAAQRVIQSINPVTLTDGKTLGDALASPQVERRVRGWLEDRPVTRVDFKDNMDVEVALGVDDAEFFDVIRSAVETQPNAAVPTSPDEWNQLRRELERRRAPAVGQARCSLVSPATKTGGFHIPSRAPDWIEQQIVVIGEAQGGRDKLQNAARADTIAKAKLRSTIEALELEKGLTIAQAARQDPRIADVIERTIRRAVPFKTEYRGNSGAAVHVQADLHDLWDDLRDLSSPR